MTTSSFSFEFTKKWRNEEDGSSSQTPPAIKRIDSGGGNKRRKSVTSPLISYIRSRTQTTGITTSRLSSKQFTIPELLLLWRRQSVEKSMWKADDTISLLLLLDTGNRRPDGCCYFSRAQFHSLRRP